VTADGDPQEPPSQETLRAEAARLGLELTPEQLAQFATYEALIGEWDERAGLTSVRDAEGIQRRHFGESLALLVALRDAGVLRAGKSTSIVDVGTGAGLPGIPMRIVEPALRLTLVEATSKKCVFLEAAVEALGLDRVRVVNARAEDAARDRALRGRFEVATAKALAALPVLIEYTVPLLRDGGLLAAPKGSRVNEEVEASQGALYELHAVLEPGLRLPLPDDVPPQTIVMVRRSGPLDARYPRRAGLPSKEPLT